MRHSKLRIVTVILVGVTLGVGAFTFHYAEGTAYMSDDPSACLNCHVMRPQFTAWERGRHHAVTTCNDCHVPHDLVGKWLTKSLNGWHHSKAFTLGGFPEHIRIHEPGLAVVEANCVRCHGQLFHQPSASHAQNVIDDGCVRCHPGVAHAAEHTHTPDRFEQRGIAP